MKSHYLLSNKYKLLGWILLILGLIGGVFLTLSSFESDLLRVNVLAIIGGESGIVTNSDLENPDNYFKIIENSILDEIITLMIIIGGLIVGFTKEKVEDEFISKLRTDSLIWAILVNYIILMLATLFIYEFTFFNILVYNMFTPLLFFIIRFNFLKARA